MRFLMVLVMVTLATPAAALCGFYVGSADGALVNKTSRVVYARDRTTSVITMLSDYQGPLSDFALIVPTPTVLKRDQVRTINVKTVDHLAAYSAPRLVEYADEDPCNRAVVEPEVFVEEPGGTNRERYRGARALGVTIKEEYAVGDYDIQILAARQSDGLALYLVKEGYKVPDGAEEILAGYIGMGMKFFVAKVNLSRHAASKSQELPPLQMRFTSRDFMLPIQLGKLNGTGAQDLQLFALTRTGRVVTTNYRVEELPSDAKLPVFVKQLFPEFYRAAFSRIVGNSGVVLEYAWDMAWCDPCAADPLSDAELQELGVGWLKGGENAGQDVFVTRLHIRYDQNSMPQDLMLKVTKDKTTFQGRFVVQTPYVGPLTCEAGKDYLKDIRIRLRKEAVTVQDLTGWDPRKIEKLIRADVPPGYW